MNKPGPFPVLASALLAAGLLLSPASAPALDEITPAALRTAEKKIQTLARETTPAVVALIPGGDTPRPGSGSGSGVVVGKDGLILSAAHVAVELGDEVIAVFPDGSRAEVEVLGMDFDRDAAMLQITGGGEYPFVELGDARALETNQWCVGLGHPGGYQADRSPPVRLGRVIDDGAGEGEEFLLTDCALVAGDSGGPLFDIEGRLIGIHSNIGRSLMQNRHVPLSVFEDSWDRLLAGERFGGDHIGGFLENPYRPMVGAVLEDADSGGALVLEVEPDSPADEARLRPGDIVVESGGNEIDDVNALLLDVAGRKAGDELLLGVRGEKGRREVEVTLAEARSLGRFGRSDPSLRRRPGEAREPRAGREQEESGRDAPGPDGSELEALRESFSRRLRDSLRDGEFDLEAEDIEKLGGPLEIADLIREFAEDLSEEEREQLLELGSTPSPPSLEDFDPDAPLPVGEEFFREVLDAFHPSVRDASDSTHPVFRGSERKSLCTVVHQEGFALTKLSEIDTDNNQALTVMLAKGERRPAEMVKVFPREDLALLRISGARNLVPVEWSERSERPVGALVAAPGSGPDALAIGVVSVPTRSLSGRNKGFLGIGPAPHPEGVRVAMVLPDHSAAEAGVREGDVITEVNGVPCDTPEKLIKLISGSPPGEPITIDYLRGGEAAQREIILGDRAENDRRAPDPLGRMNRLGTGLSKRRRGYEKVIQTDLPIEPAYCGGPLVDLGGKAIGLNIARAGRVNTYALPAELVREKVEPVLERELKRIEERKRKRQAEKAGKVEGKKVEGEKKEGKNAREALSV